MLEADGTGTVPAAFSRRTDQGLCPTTLLTGIGSKPMESNQLKASLVQTLENYQRCGVSRFGKLDPSHFPPALLEEVAKLANPSSAADLAQTMVNAQAAQSPVVPPAAIDPKSSSPSVSSSPIGVTLRSLADQHWSLPVLPESQRREAFQTLDAQVKACRQCGDIVSFRQQTVFGEGALQPTVCFMGEAPGADEDRQGRPFIGKAGQLLTKIISAMKFNREDVYILNALKCRPPQNRTPVPEEIEHCRTFVETQLNVLQPKYIVCLGAVAVRSLLQSTLPIGHLRGTFHQYRGAKVVVTYHPSYLLRNESAKRLVWEDMQMLMKDMSS